MPRIVDELGQPYAYWSTWTKAYIGIMVVLMLAIIAAAIAYPFVSAPFQSFTPSHVHQKVASMAQIGQNIGTGI